MEVLDLKLLREQLRVDSFVHASFAEIGLEFDAELATKVIDTSTDGKISPAFDEEVAREYRVISPSCRSAARLLMQPVVDTLFPSGNFEDKVRREWVLFGVNYYREGATFPPHLDLINPELATIIVVSLCGKRIFRIRGKSLTLDPQSIVIMDGGANPEHTASCIEGPSVSVVADVPSLFY